MKNLNQMYNDDQYITIFNPTDEVKYLDGLALCVNAIDPSKAIQFAPKDDFVNRYYGASGISYFPGKGNDYPVKPGQTIIVAKYAIDHKAKFEAELEGEDLSMYGGLNAFLDLSKADFEWTNSNHDPGQKNNPNVPDMNAILTSTDASGNIGPAYEFSHISESNGIALIKPPWLIRTKVICIISPSPVVPSATSMPSKYPSSVSSTASPSVLVVCSRCVQAS